MKTKRNSSLTILLIVLCVVNLNAFASGTNSEIASRLKLCIDEQTFAVIRVNLEKMNLGALIDNIIAGINKSSGLSSTKQMQNDLHDFKKSTGTLLDSLREAGCRDIFTVFSMYDFPYFFVAVPVYSGVNRDNLVKNLNTITEEAFNVGKIEHYVSENLVLVGLEQTITRLKTISPVQSESLNTSFKSCADSSVQVVLFPSSDQRRILIEMLPAIQYESDTIELTPLAKDMLWAAMDFNTPSSVSMNLTIQGSNSDAAQRIMTLIQNFYSMIAQNHNVREVIPAIEKVLKNLTPQRQNDRLLIQINSGNSDWIMNDLIAPVLLKINSTAARYACSTNLSGIGKALLIYANDYDDKFPPDLDTLIPTVEMTPRGIMCPATRLKDSYIYRGADLSTSDVPYLVTVHDKKGNHQDGRYVLFLDSHVEWVTEERFMELIEADNKYRREKGYREIPVQ